MPVSEEDITRAFEEYHNAVGKVSSSWNHLQEGIGHLFCLIAGVNFVMGFAIWYSTNSDRSQREMLRAAVEAPSGIWKGKIAAAKDDVIWLLDRVNSLADARNDAIHAPVSVRIKQGKPELTPFEVFGNTRAKKLAGKDLLNQFKIYDHMALQLMEYSREIQQGLTGLVPWPQRPVVPSLKQTKNHKG